METIEIEQSRTLEQSAAAFVNDVRGWMSDCRRAYGDAAATDVHDQGTYTVSWLPVLQAAPMPEIKDFLRTTRDRIRRHFRDTQQWRHGYWRRHEIHHGTEHFELFLGMLAQLDPGDRETSRQLVDAAEHLGNWVDGIPEWYDWDNHRFRSMYFGTESVGEADEGGLNVPDHFRGMTISLIAWDVTGEDRCIELACDAAAPWVKAILGAGELPSALGPDGPVYDLRENAVYGNFVGMAPKSPIQIDRAENLLASAAPDVLLRLWSITRDPDYVAAAERILDVLCTHLLDPDAGSAIDALRKYRNLTGDGRYDERIKVAMGQARPGSFSELGLQLPEKTRGSRVSGVGKRGDKPDWFEDGKPRRHSPVLWAHVAELSGDEVLAALALDLARAYFRLARRVFPDGREHGCSARTVSAVARGHGRENNAGVVTAVLGPVLQRFNLGCS